MHKILVVISIVLVCGCDSEPPEETVWDDQLKSIDKAKQTEQMLLDAAKQQKEQIEQHIE